MRRIATVFLMTLLPLGAFAQGAGPGQQVHTGKVERVWEDGFRLNTGSRNFKVDTWDVFGDNTPRHVRAGDQVEVRGEFSGGEFDATSVTGGSGSGS
jgi:hypothetical protein